MEDDRSSPVPATEVAGESEPASARGGGGWGGWGFSVFSDLQKAAEEISRNAVEAAKTAAKSIAELEGAEDSESSKEEDMEGSAVEEENEDESAERRKAALEKLENASEESLLGQGLKVLDSSVENFASGAWQALGSAWKGGSEFVHKLEHSAVNLAESIQQGGLPAAGSVAPSLIESGKAFTAKGMQVLELVGKETMDLLINETGMEVEKYRKLDQTQDDEDQLLEDVTFDRCFYIYGGPEQLEELESLSNHYAMLFNRRKAKLQPDQKSLYEGKLKQVQKIFSLSSEVNGNAVESEKGKKIDIEAEIGADEMKILRDTSISKAAEMAAGFANALAGQSSSDIIQRTVGRLDALHSEGVHRLSEICCCAVSQLLMFGKSIISNVNKVQNEDVDDEMLKIDWPQDFVEKANFIRTRAELMTGDVEAVCGSFITGIADVTEAYIAAIKGVGADSQVPPENSIQDKVNTFSENLRSDKTTALGKIQEGLEYMPYVLLSTSIPAA